MPDQTESLFPTLIYRASLPNSGRLNHELEQAASALAESDMAGRRWCLKHGYAGYTSYGSLADLPERSEPFARLKRLIEQRARRFARDLHWDLRGGKPLCDSMWVNVLPEGGSHSSHLHTNAVLSGTYYVRTPRGCSGLKFEDPRLDRFMAAPPRRARARQENRVWVTLPAEQGYLVLFESWLRHEVAPNPSDAERISISFNYSWF